MFTKVPKPKIFIGSMLSPSPDKIDLKKIENIMKGIPHNIVKK